MKYNTSKYNSILKYTSEAQKDGAVSTEEEIKKKMAENSAAWHTADAETRKQLEAENQKLGARLGASYDSASGKWSDQSGNALYTVNAPTTDTTGTTGKTDANSPYTPNPVVPSGNTGGSQYTPLGTHNDAGLSADALAKIDIYKNIYNNAIASGDTATAEAAHEAAEAIRKQFGYSGGADGSDYIALDKPQVPTYTPTPTISASDIAGWNDNYNETYEQPTYESKYDQQIEDLLKEILTREDFSYDAAKDPLYQQYANMYRREGDRAMRDTMAEAAASAGGMNTYAMTAAQQANNYYNSQLNDRMPELYQLAYEMYLADKESKVQDLGLLQNLDESQYGRYRDTMSDWRNDKSFAYGVFQDAVAQGNWQTNFDRGVFESDRDYNFKDYWQGKEFDTSNSRYDTEAAKDEVWRLIQLGVTPSADLVAKAGMSETDVALAVEAVKAGETSNTGYTGGNGNDRDDYTGGRDKGDYVGNTGTDNQPSTSGITDEMKKKAATFTNNNALAAYIDGLVNVGTITQEEGDSLYAQYVDENEKYITNEDGTYSDKHSYSDMIKSTLGWAVENGGGTNWFWGVDNNAIVKAPNGELIRLDVLLEKLQEEGMSKSEAKAAIKALQKNLDI